MLETAILSSCHLVIVAVYLFPAVIPASCSASLINIVVIQIGKPCATAILYS